MCQFLSAIVLRNGDIICRPEVTDSHENLIAYAGLSGSDRGYIERFVRVEFTPRGAGDYANAAGYKLRVDESATPAWFDDAMAERVAGSLRAMIQRMIVADKRAILLGGCWILADGASVDRVVGARLFAMLGTSSVGEMWDTSSVGTMWDTSSVGTMWGTSSVGTMRGTSSVGTMLGTSSVGTMLGTSSVGEMRGTSSVGTMWGASSVGEMRGTSSVGTMWGASSVGEMRGTSSVGTMLGTSSVKNGKRKKAVKP